jgi:hypothetical protein
MNQIPGDEARVRILTLTPKSLAMISILKHKWKAMNAAVAKLDRELLSSLEGVAREAIAALVAP